MLLPSLIPMVLGLAQLSWARQADMRMHLDECREIKSMGLNTCAYCNWDGVARCDTKAYWDMCQDNPTPNPCRSDEILAWNSRDYATNYDDTCKKICPGLYCYSNTNIHKSMCCGCPKGYVPSITPPTCWGKRGSGVPVTCVGCNNPEEVLTGNDQKGWECQLKKQTPICDRACSKDTWCPAKSVQKVLENGKTVNLCQCTSGNCKGKDATCPSACLGRYQMPKNCPAVSCPKVKDKDKCWPSQEGLDLIKSSENHCSTFYNVCDGAKTIGWGHNCNAHKDCDGLKLPLAPCESERLFKCDVTDLMQRVKRLPNYQRLSHNQFSALVSLAYQYPLAFNKGRAIWKHMDVKASEFNYRTICKDILTATSNHASRRKKESQLCLKGPVTPMKC